MMKPRRVAAVVLRQFYLLRGSPSRIVPQFAWAAVDIVLWGFLARYFSSLASPGFSFVAAFVGAVLFWDFFIRIMQGVDMVFLEDVWSHNFLNLFGSPLSISEYLTGLIVSTTLLSLIGLAAMILLATLAFGLSFAAYGLWIAPFFLILFFFGIALGVLSIAAVLRFGPSAEWFVWPIPALLAPFVGVIYPLSTLPPWMRRVSLALPPSYVFEAMRGLVAGKPPAGALLLLPAALAALYALGAWAAFAATYRHCVRVGLIARYSAETAG